MDILAEAKKVFDTEIDALIKTKNALDCTFVKIIDMITLCEGKVIITGMGKPGHIAKKIAATMASLGTASFCLHPAEALHGDLGMVSKEDIVIIISYSGESEEITKIIPNIKMIGAKIIAISGNMNSTLVKYSDISQILPKFDEACYMRLAPTSSTTSTLVYGDALAIVASMKYGFNENNYGLYHPAGSLGKKLFLKVEDLMFVDEDTPTVHKEVSLKDAIIEMNKKPLGVVIVIEDNGKLAGIITDGDLRRQFEKSVDVYTLRVENVMTTSPIFTQKSYMAVDVLKQFKKRQISNMPVVDENMIVVGVITLQAILNAGIVL